MNNLLQHHSTGWWRLPPGILLVTLLAFAGCARQPVAPPPHPNEVRAKIARLMPADIPDRNGWAADIQTAFSTLAIPPSDENLCAVLAVTVQESTFQAAPPVPGLAKIARQEIQRRADRLHVPRFLVNAALRLESPDGKTYEQRLARVRTPRIAIGDNLLQRPFVSDLMRLNKSFIVRRSLTGRREKLAAYQVLSAYINHSIRNDGESVWIAQAEGRAKDGDDRTDSAILKMLHMSRKDEESFAETLTALRPTPVSISYEYDPCDQAKARELYIRATTGSYTKAPGEDDTSIALGITGYKGRVHISFGRPIEEIPDDAKQLAAAVDRQILGSYRLFPVHYLAYRIWDERDPQLAIPSLAELFSEEEIAQAEAEWSKRLAACPSVQQPYLIQQYANPVRNRYRLESGLEP